MSEPHLIRFFADDAAIRRVGTAFLDHSLPAAEWTHEAHIATCAWLHIERPDIDPPRDLPRLISAFNLAKGGVNDDSSGYHETITQAYVRGVRSFRPNQRRAVQPDRHTRLAAALLVARHLVLGRCPAPLDRTRSGAAA
jgi:hypothetical protein